MLVLPGRRPRPVAPGLPARGAAVGRLGVPLPPERMAMLGRGGVLKRWRYVGVYSPDLLLCVGQARIGPFPRAWWAVALPGGGLHEGSGDVRISDDASRVSVEAPSTEIQLDLEPGGAEGVETASPAGERGNYIWTRKRGGVPVRGMAVVEGRSHRVDGRYGFLDESAGYHARHTTWRWSAGVGRTETGQRVAWNLVTGIHDAPQASERTVWVEGRPRELAAVSFADDLSGITFSGGDALLFQEWCAREETVNRLVVRSSYRQPFGTFSGVLPGGGRLSEGHGVMEYHDVWW